MNRDEMLVALRPSLNLENVDTKTLEVFQNQTLRPILKLQQDLTFSLLENHKYYKTQSNTNAPRQQYEIFLKKYLQSNTDLKHQILGAIIGQFTSKELEYYFTERKAINKRIMGMQIKRFLDTIY